MPEGHTLHRLARTLNRRLGGHQVRSSSPQGRFAAGAAAVDGRVLTRADAWGKHLLVSFADVPEQVHVHLGLYGKLALSGLGEGGEVLPAVGQVRWRLVGGGGVALRPRARPGPRHAPRLSYGRRSSTSTARSSSRTRTCPMTRRATSSSNPGRTALAAISRSHSTPSSMSRVRVSMTPSV